MTNLILQNCKERKCKGDDEEHENKSELEEGLQDVFEHDNIDAKPRELLGKQHQVDPGQEYSNSSNIPLPGLKLNSKCCKLCIIITIELIN